MSATRPVPPRRRLPRTLHPAAWWLWALAMAAAASQTLNPLLLAVVLAVVGFVVMVRRTDAPWARGFRAYLLLAGIVIAVRVVFRMLLGGGAGQTVLFTLPELQLAEAAAGIRIGGPVTAEGMLAALYDGMRLATMLVCIGAAQALANPKRLLRALPGALHEAGTAVVVALGVAPQLVSSTLRVRRARRLRGSPGRGMSALRAILVPVLEDALDRSLALAAAMDSRGYGRVGDAPARARRWSGILVVAGLLAVCVGLYGLLDGTSPTGMGAPTLAAGTMVAAAGMWLGGRHVTRTVHRPDPWRVPETVVAVSGLAVAAVMFALAGSDPRSLTPTLTVAAWPPLPVLPAVVLLFGIVPAIAAPPPPADPAGRATRPVAAPASTSSATPTPTMAGTP